MASNVKWYGDKLIKEVDAKCLKGVEKACPLVVDDAQRLVRVATGNLRSKIRYEVEQKKDEVVGRIGANVDYALAQEYGTSTQSGQPYLRPALEKNKGKIKQLLKGK